MARLPVTVLVTRQIYQQGIEYLQQHIERVIVYDKDQGMPQDELKAQAKGAAGILCMLSDKIDASVIDAAGDSLKVVSTLSVGYDHIDVAHCKAKGIKVGNTPGVLTNATVGGDAKTLLFLTEAKTGGWGTWKPKWLCGTELAGKTVGIIGLGRIGAAVAKRCRAFEIGRLLYWGRSEKPAAAELHAEFVSRDQLLKESDIVILTCALSEDTKNILNASTFKLMKPTAIVINSARGACVNQDDLVVALRDGQIQAAGLDVTTPEPLPTSHPLFALPNCIILPHIGSASLECRTVMSVMSAKNIVAALTGDVMPAEVL